MVLPVLTHICHLILCHLLWLQVVVDKVDAMYLRVRDCSEYFTFGLFYYGLWAEVAGVRYSFW